MSVNRSTAGIKASRVSKALGFAVALFATGLATFWGSQIAMGVPEAYRGEHAGGLLLAVGMVLGNVGLAVTSWRIELALQVASAVALAGALYFISMH